MDKILNYIGGVLVEPKSGSYLDNIEPATGKVYSQIPDSDAVDIEAAVAAAKKAQDGWASMPAEDRSLNLLTGIWRIWQWQRALTMANQFR